MFPSLVEKLSSQVLEAAAASLLMYNREVIDYPVGIRLQVISRSLDMRLEI
jgi:hypothetical protein